MTDKRIFTIVEQTDAPADIMLGQLHSYFQGLAGRIEALAEPQHLQVIIQKEEFDMKAEIRFPILAPTFASDDDENHSFFWVSASAENPMNLAVTVVRTDEDQSYAQKVEKMRLSKGGLGSVIDRAFGMHVPVPLISVDDQIDEGPRANEIRLEKLDSIVDITSMAETYMKREIQRVQALAAALQKLQALKL